MASLARVESAAVFSGRAVHPAVTSDSQAFDIVPNRATIPERSGCAMNVFLSCVSTEFKTYRLRLANQLGALKDHPYEIKVQEDFQQGGYTLLDKLADYGRECDLVIHFAGDACGARPTTEHVQALYRSLGEAPPDPLPDRSYTQWEYGLALRFQGKMLVYLAAAGSIDGELHRRTTLVTLPCKPRSAPRHHGR